MDFDIEDYCGQKLDELLGDPLLADISQDATVEEIEALTGLEYGQAMSLTICRADGESYKVIVNLNATVLDLKAAIQRKVALQMQRTTNFKFINWKYVWRCYWLSCNRQKLQDDGKRLQEYGIRNHDELYFVKRLRSK